MATNEDTTRHLVTQVDELFAEPGDESTVQVVVENAVALLPEADFASLTIRAQRQHRTIAATSLLANQCDDLQYALEEGPCLDTAEDAEWFHSADLQYDGRWPRWGRLAAQLGVKSVLSVKMRAQSRWLGALNIYSQTEGAFADRDDVTTALLYANNAAMAMASARQLAGLETALQSRHVIGVAQGILMERLGLSPTAAFDVLRRYSREHDIPLRDLAAGLIETQELPAPLD